MSTTDLHGLTLTGASRTAADLYEQSVAAYQCYAGDPVTPLETAIADSPAFVMAHVMKAYLHLIGSNAEAVRLSGIHVSRHLVAVYVISGVCSAAAGIISTSRSGVGSATVGVGAELEAIAAVVIGGASLAGGRGGVVNTFIGVLVLGVINNIMNLAGVPGFYQGVVMGGIIIVAVLLQQGTSYMQRR